MIGKKAEGLTQLQEAGFNVPDFFVVTSPGDDISQYIDENTLYAVRSSGTSEDLAGASFAGLYDSFLNVKGYANLLEAVKKCMDSVNNERVTEYAKHNHINTGKMAVIVQRMVNSEKSGVAFSIDSINGFDKVIIIEAVSGLGDKLVSGHVTPDYYAYNWYDEKFTTYNGGVLTQDEVRKLCEVILDIQIFYGFPVDVEWAMANGEIYILQSRPITTISCRAIHDEWTTANFRDGGVSSKVCKPLISSLYALVFTSSFLDFYKATKLLPQNYKDVLSYDMIFGRPYWRLTTEKDALSRLPGFVEREIDDDLGVIPAYEGDGIVTSLTPKSLFIGTQVLFATNKYIKNAEIKAREYIKEFAERTQDIDLSGKTSDELHKIWVRFVKEDYCKIQYTYFIYIACNLVLSATLKDKVKKHLPSNEFMNLCGGLSDISHMAPMYAMWSMSQRGYTDEEFEEFIAKYKHHSQYELDLSYPNWDETPDVVREMIADFNDISDPKKLGENQKKKYYDTLAKLPGKLHKDIETLRKFLWLREEFRDFSTKAHYIIRRLSLALGREWVKEGILDAEEDVFFLSVEDIYNKKELNHAVSKNKKYYCSFDKFNNPNEIGAKHMVRNNRIDGAQILKGVPCSGETVTGTARVINDIHDADKLKPGDILVTRCTDPAWTAVFSKLSGVITETGGMLSHAAVVSREYGLACILVVKNATNIIQDGDMITMDCKTGEIYKRQEDSK